MSDLLVPFDAFTKTLPAGLPVVDEGERAVLGEAADPQDPVWEGILVDLSAPPVDDDGNPLRLDVLEWALGVLDRRGLDWFRGCVETMRPWPGGRQFDGLDNEFGRTAFGRPSWWPPLVGMDEDTARRAVVAAALRARVGLGTDRG